MKTRTKKIIAGVAAVSVALIGLGAMVSEPEPRPVQVIEYTVRPQDQERALAVPAMRAESRCMSRRPHLLVMGTESKDAYQCETKRRMLNYAAL